MCENILNPRRSEGKFRLCFLGAVNYILERQERNHRDLPELNMIPVCNICLVACCL